MPYSFYCPCGYRSDDMDDSRRHMEAGVPAYPDSCCNCSGRECMDCVMRILHDECVSDCPICCT